MKLKVNTKALIASTVALAVIPFTKATAETLEDWVARSVDEIKHDIQQSGENQQTYTIKYGDTLIVLFTLRIFIIGNSDFCWNNE